ncbi:MAG: hypothetical protein K2X00_10385 [Nitrospiraceae bacterium]|nr:hypothetical protein [Nitrospiraceae bacterium]
MGTSQSSLGSPSGVPLVPPWVPNPLPPSEDESGEDIGDDTLTATPPSPPLVQTGALLAPPGRFGPARTSLGRFGKSGSADDMRSGIGHYVNKGLGGASSAARRFEGTAQTAGSLYGALSRISAGQPYSPGSPLDPALLSGCSVDEVMDAVVEAVRPIDGTQDTEASQNAIRDALSELLERFPDADLLNLSKDQRLFVIEHYLSGDVFNRLCLDIGKAVRDKAPNYSVALSRFRQIREYVRETISARFRALTVSGKNLSSQFIVRIGAHALREAFDVFEEFVK